MKEISSSPIRSVVCYVVPLSINVRLASNTIISWMQRVVSIGMYPLRKLLHHIMLGITPA
jgi:hypothetical protein